MFNTIARKYMKALKLYKLEQERIGALKSAAQLKEERAQKLAVMSEEEKAVFYEEEKEEKKKEWVKKQARKGYCNVWENSSATFRPCVYF